MKRLLIITMTILSLAAACQGPDLGLEEPVVVLPEGAVVMQDMGFGMYYGDINEDGMGMFYLVISDARCYQDDLNNPYLDSEGDMLVLRMRTPLLAADAKMELPVGFEAQIRPRSGLALKHDLMLTNSPGTIDAGYRGEVGVIMYNAGKVDFAISRGDRIAQMVICKLPEVVLSQVDGLSDTDRGEGGFGSSGKH